MKQVSETLPVLPISMILNFRMVVDRDGTAAGLKHAYSSLVFF